MEGRFSITVPRIFVLHCLNNIPGGIYEIWKEFYSQKLGDQYALFPFLEVGYGRYLIALLCACFENKSEMGAGRGTPWCDI